MSDMPPASFSLDASENIDPVAAAFDRMTGRMAALIAATEGFAARQQEIHERDYPRSGEIRFAQERIREAIDILDKRLAMQMTVESIAASIERAGATARAADHQGITEAQRQLAASTQKLERIVVGRIDLRQKCNWRAAGAGTGAILGAEMIVGDVVPSMLDRPVPARWIWPEERAASDLNMSGSNAGRRLMQVYDPVSWRQLMQADALARDNAAIIARCRARAVVKKAAIAVR